MRDDIRILIIVITIISVAINVSSLLLYIFFGVFNDSFLNIIALHIGSIASGSYLIDYFKNQ